MQDRIELPARSPEGFKLFLMGFLNLFIELALIRYLSGNIWNLGYFPNLVLLAVFTGMGLGFAFHVRFASEKISIFVYNAAFFILASLLVFVYYMHPKVPGLSLLGGEIGGELFFSNTLTTPTEKENYLPFIICFISVIAIFILLSQRTAKLFALFKPLTAYSLDIGGSCAGIIGFMIISRLSLPAYMWFIAITAIFPFTLSGPWKYRTAPLLAGAAAVLFSYAQDLKLLSYPDYIDAPEVVWSPYQKIERLGLVLFVNGIGHQRMETESGIPGMFYQGIYDHRLNEAKLPAYKDVLIIGAGTGNDAAAALMNDARSVDAVEIDPVIAKIGKAYHPCNPYKDPRVNLVVNDGRAFMTNSKKKYDLIVFALTDSTIRVSSMSQLRLENYLFTVESVRRAYELLNDNGDIIFYNMYRRPWLIDKIARIIKTAVGKYPLILLEPKPPAYFTVIEIGKSSYAESYAPLSNETTATASDDWPFLYLKKRAIPKIYIIAMIIIAAALIGVVVFSSRSRGSGLDADKSNLPISARIAFVFMGAAFMLLETKSVIQFSLLFGATWLNNSLVFLAILILVLAANYTATIFKQGEKNIFPIYILLMLSTLAAIVYPAGNMLKIESLPIRFAAASIFTFSPIFFANLIFSIAFARRKFAERVFGWNLMGAVIGGISEYGSMYLGYRLLSVFVAVFYTIVFAAVMTEVRVDKCASKAGNPNSEKY